MAYSWSRDETRRAAPTSKTVPHRPPGPRKAHSLKSAPSLDKSAPHEPLPPLSGTAAAGEGHSSARNGAPLEVWRRFLRQLGDTPPDDEVDDARAVARAHAWVSSDGGALQLALAARAHRALAAALARAMSSGGTAPRSPPGVPPAPQAGSLGAGVCIQARATRPIAEGELIQT